MWYFDRNCPVILIYFNLYALSVASEVNTSLFGVEYKPLQGKGVTYCIRNIIKEIVEHEDFVNDVILMNLNDNVVDIPKFHGIRKARFVTRTYSWTHSKIPNRIYVINCLNIKEFMFAIKQAMEDKHFNMFARFIIVLDNFNMYVFFEMTNYLRNKNIFNVTILLKYDHGDDYRIYSFQSPIQPCSHQKRLALVSNCSSYNGTQNIFPEMDGLQGCTFQFLTHNLFPFINIDNEGEEGIEQTMMRLFEKYANIKINLIPYYAINTFGEVATINKNTLIELLKKDYEGAVGGYFISYDLVASFTYTYPLLIDHFMVILPRSHFLSTWAALFHKAFFVFVLFFILLIALSISVYALSLFPTQRADPVRDTLIVFGYFLNKVTIRKFKKGVPETFLAFTLLISTFIIPYIIQAYMSSIKTHPVRDYEVKDLSEVLQCCQLFVPWEWNRDEWMENSKNCNSRWDCLKILMETREKTGYTFLADIAFEAYKWKLADEQCKVGMYKLKDPVAKMMRTVYLRRGSVFAKPFDKFLLKAMSGGLLKHPFMQMVQREKIKCWARYVPRGRPVDIKELMAPFHFLVAGQFLSAIIFAYELITRPR